MPALTVIARRLAAAARCGTVAALALAIVASAMPAQGYRIRMDASAQAVSFRGVALDSIASAEAVPGSGGGLETPDGHAVRCSGGTFCFFFRPGPQLRAVPVATTASLALWGLGVEGLSARATGRVAGDLGGDDAWPGTSPAVQLLEAYVEYERSVVRARGGRLLIASRLEPIGFDGAWARARWDAALLEITGYGGWGFGQAVAIPASSASLNPLDEWRPRDRQVVGGAELAWLGSAADVRAEYRREIDPRDGNFVSERAALSFGTRVRQFHLNGGVDYNFAESHLGSADLTVTYAQPRFSASAGARRYRPYFSLWTLWGAFSPVPYNAVHASASVSALSWLSLRARGERYKYEDAEVSTALVPRLEDGGWRASAGASATPFSRWTFDGVFGAEFGPGASARFVEGSADFTPTASLSLGMHAGILERPLELRYYDAERRWIGGRGQWQVTSQRRLWADVTWVDDDRNRPDASASSLAHVRARAGVSLAFGSRADRQPLPPARRPRR